MGRCFTGELDCPQCRWLGLISTTVDDRLEPRKKLESVDSDACSVFARDVLGLTV